MSAAEQDEIDAERPSYPTVQALSLQAMRIVQRHRRWLSDDAIADIATYLHVSPEALDSVATFYNLIFRKPVGRHIIRVCDSVSCWVMGQPELNATLEKELGIKPGGTTKDQRFTLLPSQCLGICDRAPVALIDDDVHLNAKTLPLERYP